MSSSSKKEFWRGVGVGIVIMPTLLIILVIIWDINSKDVILGIYLRLAEIMTEFYRGCVDGILKFFNDWVNVFTSVGYLAVTIGLPFTIIQVRNAKKRTRANISYQIRKDGRVIYSSLSDQDRSYIDGITDDANVTNEIKANSEIKIHEILMHYASIYNQWKYRNIDDTFFENVIMNEICNFLNKDRVRDYWTRRILEAQLWTEEFVQMCEECFEIEGGNNDTS